jgi:2-polyprenyl-3-methyl-5-hydroxy-6-metoxy-1,4-benzoquinol methylase
MSASMRARVAERYLVGTGVEFGALHCPLAVPESVTVKYADMESIERLRATFPDIKDIRAPDIVTDIESMRGIGDASMDFVIANHVLEHVEDPLQALASTSRVLRPSGIAFIALPDKRFTFDKDRDITSIEHLIKDHEQGPDWSLAGHYDEWVRCVDGLSGDEHKQKYAMMLEKRSNIHFHVWDYRAMLEMFAYVTRMPGMDLQVEMSMLNGIEVVWILRKYNEAMTSVPTAETPRDVSSVRPPCPVCGERTGHHVYADATWGCNIFKCDDCTATFVWPPVEQDFKDVPASHIRMQVSESDKRAADFTLNYVMEATRRKKLGRGAKLSVLDVGCGPGHMLAHFKANGWDVRGVDPWTTASAAGRDAYQIPIETAKLEHAKIEPDSQDVVLLIDVLQFIGKPRHAMDACMNALKPGGVIYLTVPNFGSAESRRDGWKWQNFLPWCYVNYFTVPSLLRLLENAGFFRIKITPSGGLDDDVQLLVTAYRPVVSTLTWADLSEDVADEDLPVLDRRAVDVARLSAEQRSWRENGYIIVKGLIPDELIERYCAVRIKQPHAQGWSSPSPYLEVPEIRDLCLYKPLTDLLEKLIGEAMGLHLNLTGWVSTERDWHQDDYLNPPMVNAHYAAVWTALDQIESDAGPFEFVPGSHRWPIIRQAKILDLLGYEDGSNPHWPWESERLLTPFFEREIKERGSKIERFLGSKGDVLIWHSRLLHRGSLAQRPGAERRSMIAHYSAVKYRPDMPRVRRHRGGGQYFVLDESVAASSWPLRDLKEKVTRSLRALRHKALVK